MKNTDLMIGDWVNTKRGHARIIYIGKYSGIYTDNKNEGEVLYSPCELNPIPLTAEILEKNGFESAPAPSERVWMRNGQEVWLDNEGKNYWANIKNGEFYFEGYIEYIHELQHFLRLCGVELEIKL